MFTINPVADIVTYRNIEQYFYKLLFRLNWEIGNQQDKNGYLIINLFFL